MFLGMIGLMILAGVLQMLLVAVIMTALSALFSSVIQSREQVYKLGHPPVNKGWPVEDIPFRTEHFFFSSADGLELAAIQYHPNGPPKGVILACHYLGGSKQSIFPLYRFSAGAWIYSGGFRLSQSRGKRFQEK